MAMTDEQRSWLGSLFKRDGAAPSGTGGPPTAETPGIVSQGLTMLEDAVGGGSALANLKKSGRGAPADGDLDEGEGKNRDGTVRRKPGQGGQSRGRDSKRAQDSDVDDAVRDFGLTEDERQRLHEEVGGRDLDRNGVRDEAKAIRDGRKQPKAPDGAPDRKPAAADDKPADPPASEKSTPDSIIDGAEMVAGVALAVGLVAAPIPVVDVAVDGVALGVAAVAGVVIAGASIYKALTGDDKPPDA